MESLSGLTAFVRAADTLSFVKAGRLLGVSASAIGKSVARLEEKLGVRLFQRSTRHIRLTAEGALYYERCQRIIADLADADAELARTLEAPRGKLRVSMPVVFYRLLLPHLPIFMQRYPDVELDLDFNDRLVDVIEEGLDVVVRSGTLTDSRLMARPLGPFRRLIVGSPTYLARQGRPALPDDLATHACLHYKFLTSGKLQEWVLADDETVPPLPTTLICNNIEALIRAAEQGLGLAYLPDFLVRDALASGALERVLPSHARASGQFWVLWPSSRHLSPKLRVFVDFLCAHLLAPEVGETS
ncbi:MAG: LysR family transcriptional regulator [Burkholderiales bacterium]|nr:LysR family transcriptional regulator [Burkholderiales bacterium]